MYIPIGIKSQACVSLRDNTRHSVEKFKSAPIFELFRLQQIFIPIRIKTLRLPLRAHLRTANTSAAAIQDVSIDHRQVRSFINHPGCG
jgi:hypothetical protein